jgi:hypothetical protein
MITKIAVATTATLVDAAFERQWLMIQNQSDTAIFLSFDGTATVTTDSGATPGIRLAPYDTIMSTDISGRFTGNNFPIYAIHGGTGTKNLVVQEV